MGTYTRSSATKFKDKDSLATGHADKVIVGAEFDTEFNAIATALNTKAELNSPALTGTPTISTSPAYTLNNNQIATTKFVYDLIESGATGTNGTSIAQLFAYKMSALQPLSPGVGGSFNFSTFVLTPPTGWSTTIPTAVTGQEVYVITALASTTTVGGTDTTIAWTTPVQQSRAGQDGSGSDSLSSPITIYYSTASASAPATPTFTNGDYNFQTGVLQSNGASLGSTGWTQYFSAPALNASDKLWAATVNIYLLNPLQAGAQTFTVSAPYNWMNFDGLVTFTNLESQINTTTSINGGRIVTDTIEVNKLKSGNSLFNGVTFGLGTGESVAGKTPGGYFAANGSTKVGVISVNAGTSTNGTGSGFGGCFATMYDTTLGAAASFHGSAANTNYNTFQRQAILASSDYAGFFADTSGHTFTICNGTYSYLTSGGASGTFTGAHDGLLPLSTSIEIGDIVVDVEVVAKPNVFDAIAKVDISTTANQKGSVGIYAKDAGQDYKPHTLSTLVTDENGISSHVFNETYSTLYSDYKGIVLNSVGEGLINVCGENGNLEIGDLITTSNIAGKGMKQSDDILRGYTVAKAREAVTFNDATTVQQIACIYVCG